MSSVNWHARRKKIDIHVQNLINGQFSDSPGVQFITKYSPRDGSFLYKFGTGTRKVVNEAVKHAREAFDDGRWREQSVHQRKAVLQKLISLIETHQQELALYDCLDVGKPITNALTDDIPMTLAFLKNYVESADKLLSVSGADGSDFAYQLRKPVGVVGAIIGWNYPLLMAAMKLGPALVMGNSLVLKPSEFTPLSASRLGALVMEAGVPPGVFNVVHGAGTTVGSALAHHPEVDLLSFTGSSATGKQLMIAAGQSNMKRMVLECGGKSPYIIFDDCPDDLEFIAADIVATAFRNQGEFCSAGTRLLIHSRIKDRLLPKILKQAALLTPQDPLDKNTTFGALINEAHMNKVLAYIESAKQEGAKLIHGGKRVFVDTNMADTQGYYIEPTIFDNVNPEHKLAQEEIFGPVLSVLTFNDDAEAIQLANNSCYGLAGYAATKSLARAQQLARQLNSGYLSIVGSTTLSEGSVDIGSEPHRQSGFGYETGISALASYTVSTSVHLFA